MPDTTTETTLPVLRAIPTFFTSDNTSFTSRMDATIHELGLEFRKLLLVYFADNGNIKQIALKMAKEHHKFKNTYEKLGRAHRMVG